MCLQTPEAAAALGGQQETQEGAEEMKGCY